MINFLKVLARLCYGIIVRIKSMATLPLHNELWNGNTYFPENHYERKSKQAIFMDQVLNIMKYGYPNKFYFLYGFDVKNFHRQKDYVDYSLFMRRRDKKNCFSRNTPIVILRNKSFFGIVSAAYGINVPINIGLIQNGQVYLFDKKKEVGMRNFIESSSFDAFLKKIDGECADGVYHLVSDNGKLFLGGKESSFFELKSILEKGEFLLQEKILDQHSVISAIYGQSINTVRLVTVYNQQLDIVEVLSAVLRVGCNGCNVDNWAVGGLSIGIDTEKCTLRKYGFYKPTFGTKVTEHPDTHVIFKGYGIPYLQEAIKQAKDFHYVLRDIHSIGWDIAITEGGPCFIEGNDNWEISLMQICNHGYIEEFKRLFY